MLAGVHQDGGGTAGACIVLRKDQNIFLVSLRVLSNMAPWDLRRLVFNTMKRVVVSSTPFPNLVESYVRTHGILTPKRVPGFDITRKSLLGVFLRNVGRAGLSFSSYLR